MVENLKKLAFSEAAKANNADIIVSESIKVDYVENYKEFKAGWKIVINGYSAVYKKFRNATEADGWIKEYYENGGGVENGDSQKGGKFKLF